MPNEKMISPGVFTREVDRTFLASGIGEIGAVIIGPTLAGQAFMPTPISNPNEFDAMFGGNTDESYVPYVAKSYLKEAGVCHIVRVLGMEGWKDANTRSQGQNDFINIYLDEVLAATLVPTSGSTTLVLSEISGSGNGSAFLIKSGAFDVSASFDIGDGNYITKIFGATPKATSGNAFVSSLYVHAIYPTFADTGSTLVVSASIGKLTFDTNANYSQASTPWIQSQLVDGNVINLFKFHSISDGTSANKLVKVEISGISKPEAGEGEYGTFTVAVRDFTDNDGQQNVLETFANCNLDPTSRNYILKKIGDKYSTVDSDGRINVFGSYDRKSKYIRVEPATTLESIDNEIVPFGHDKYYNTLSGSVEDFIEVPFRGYQGTVDIYNSLYTWGIDLTNKDAHVFLAPIPDGASLNASSSFNLDNQFGHVNSSLYTGSLSGSDAPTQMLKFATAFQGGWDGMPLNRGKNSGGAITPANVFGFDCSTAGSNGTVAFKKALNSIQNQDEFDINLVVMPGIIYDDHQYVADHAIQLCTNRGDCFYIMDPVGLEDSKEDAISAVSAIDSNYVGVYYPWVQIQDTTRDRRIWVPPSVVLPAVYAFTDRVSAPWWAPAGLNRGGLTDVIELKTRLNHQDRNILYEKRVNPIVMFPSQGPTVWGQKTLQKKASALDRINVRRLLLALEKFIASSARYLVFEPNTNGTRQQFLAIVNPYMDSVQRRSGVYVYKVVMDETINTPDVIDRNILRGNIYIQPTRGAEFIELTFNIMPTGATFE